MPDENELNELNHSNQYQVVSSFEGERQKSYRMEDGKKWRQYLAAVLCKWKLKAFDKKSDEKIDLTSNISSHKKSDVAQLMIEMKPIYFS